jgi:hypothetical protein
VQARWIAVPILLVFALATRAAEPRLLQSGLQKGETVPQFYVRAVTGPLKGKSVCYVCRNGDRPVVMVLARRIDPELKKLLKDLDAVVDRHRADGLRCFGVFVGDDGRQLAPQIQTLGFDEQLSLPLTLAVSTGEGPTGQKLHADAAITVVLYRDLTVLANYAYRPGEFHAADRAMILSQTEKLANGDLR